MFALKNDRAFFHIQIRQILSFTLAGVPEDWTEPPFRAGMNIRSPNPAGNKKKRSRSIHLEYQTPSKYHTG